MNDAVIVYTNPGCQPCRMTKMMLDQQGVSYTEIDLSHDGTALERVKALGHLQAPIVETSSTSWSGFRPDLITTLTVNR
jgi:glutaredoxin-like protein NrdH